MMVQAAPIMPSGTEAKASASSMTSRSHQWLQWRSAVLRGFLSLTWMFTRYDNWPPLALQQAL